MQERENAARKELLEELEEQFRYHSPGAHQIARIAEVREAAFWFAKQVYANVQPGADRSAAIRKIREAMMTANAGIVLEVDRASAENGQDAPGRIEG